MSLDAMKQALEALEKSVSTCFDRHAHEQVMSRPEHFINQAITALRLAIEQAERV
jgi:N-methylhydantoinase B/oxoprolinase/acetone carboxylase alpha subunit